MRQHFPKRGSCQIQLKMKLATIATSIARKLHLICGSMGSPYKSDALSYYNGAFLIFQILHSAFHCQAWRTRLGFFEINEGVFMKVLVALASLLYLPSMFANQIDWVENQVLERGRESVPVSAPPREFFSMNTLYLRNKIIVHIGHDLINQSYVVIPSPNVVKVERINEKTKRVKIQQYFPDLQEEILSKYNISANKLHYLYIQSYEIYDQDAKFLDKITIPEGIQYRPPEFYTIEVPADVSVLSFIFGFGGRTAWADAGVSADLQGVYRELRRLGIDRNSSLKLDVEASSGVDAAEVFSSEENTEISQVLSDFQHIVVWGRMTEKHELVEKLLDLQNFDSVQIDLAKAAEDLKKYPHIFGDPLNPKFQSVLKKMSAERLTEKEYSSDSSASAKLGIAKIFSGEGSGSKKKSSRMKNLVKFNLEGDFYVPKSLDFAVRSANSFSMMKTLVFQAYDRLEESHFRLGTGVSLDPVSMGPALSILSNSISEKTPERKEFNFKCPENTMLGGMSSERIGKFDRSFQHECRELGYYDIPLQKEECKQSLFVNGQSKNFSFSCEGDSFLSGQKAKYLNGDRAYAFECCSLKKDSISFKKETCTWTEWKNVMHSSFSHSCPEKSLLSGVETQYLPFIRQVKKKQSTLISLGDRKYRYLCCEYGS